MSVRAGKYATLRLAVTNVIGTYTPSTAVEAVHLPPLPIPALIDIIIEYAFEDRPITQLLGTFGKSGTFGTFGSRIESGRTSASNVLLYCPTGIAVACNNNNGAGSTGSANSVVSADNSHRKLTEDKILIADTGNFELQVCEAGAGKRRFFLFFFFCTKFLFCRYELRVLMLVYSVFGSVFTLSAT
jgi:hypothetical protein